MQSMLNLAMCSFNKLENYMMAEIFMYRFRLFSSFFLVPLLFFCSPSFCSSSMLVPIPFLLFFCFSFILVPLPFLFFVCLSSLLILISLVPHLHLDGRRGGSCCSTASLVLALALFRAFRCRCVGSDASDLAAFCLDNGGHVALCDNVVCQLAQVLNGCPKELERKQEERRRNAEQHSGERGLKVVCNMSIVSLRKPLAAKD